MKQIKQKVTSGLKIQLITRRPVRRRFIVGGRVSEVGLLVAFMLAFMGVHAQQQQQAPPFIPSQPAAPTAPFPASSALPNTNLTYQIIDAPNNTFCYDVFAEGRLMIHQTSAPGLPGNEGFQTRDDAVKVAEMVMYKIRKGEMPPTVTLEEMKELGVIPLH